MFLKQLLDSRHTLAVRLTLWYGGIFTLSAVIAFILFYFLLTSFMRQQTDQDLLKQMDRYATILSIQGIGGLQEVVTLEAQAAGVEKIFIRLLYPNGEVFSSSNMEYWQDVTVSPAAIKNLIEGRSHVLQTVTISQLPYSIRVVYGFVGPGIIVQVGRSLENYARFIGAFQRVFITSVSLLTLLAIFVGWFMARRALAGVEDVTRTARRISSGNLQERVPVKTRGDEIDQLAITFNSMLDRIQTLIMGVREISDNIAHDLKSPITRIRGMAEVTLTTAKSRGEFEHMAASTIEDCDRLLDMINTMLTISKTETGAEKPRLERLDAAELVRNACDLFQPLAEDGGLRLSCGAPASVYVYGDTRMLQRMIANLLDNAVKYTPRGGRVAIRVERKTASNVHITIADTGVGISPENLPHIFERFFRCDHSRSKSGAGLGLSLAKALAQAHRGEIQVHSRPGQGTTFTVILPVSVERLPQLSPGDITNR
jgi:heavy metal sensor kinase